MAAATAKNHVFIPFERKCCGRPLIIGGQADKAKPWADHNVALLAPYAQQGVPIIGIEPSCTVTLRDEYLTLAGDAERASSWPTMPSRWRSLWPRPTRPVASKRRALNFKFARQRCFS